MATIARPERTELTIYVQRLPTPAKEKEKEKTEEKENGDHPHRVQKDDGQTKVQVGRWRPGMEKVEKVANNEPVLLPISLQKKLHEGRHYHALSMLRTNAVMETSVTTATRLERVVQQQLLQVRLGRHNHGVRGDQIWGKTLPDNRRPTTIRVWD